MTQVTTHSGLILLDKPIGLSSNQALQKTRRLLNIKKAGHTGTLDPFATGMLPICFGQATKLIEFLLLDDKTYRATLKLGQASSTGDLEGELTPMTEVREYSQVEIDAVLQSFVGPSQQIPPMYSALKHQGQPLYKLARQGKVIERAPRDIHIKSICCCGFDGQSIQFEVACSKGTYIRTLAEDIAKKLGTSGYLTALRRLSVGHFSQPMQTYSELEACVLTGEVTQHIIPLIDIAQMWSHHMITMAEYNCLLQGKAITVPVELEGRYAFICDNQLAAIAECSEGVVLKRKLLAIDSQIRLTNNP